MIWKSVEFVVETYLNSHLLLKDGKCDACHKKVVLAEEKK